MFKTIEPVAICDQFIFLLTRELKSKTLWKIGRYFFLLVR